MLRGTLAAAVALAGLAGFGVTDTGHAASEAEAEAEVFVTGSEDGESAVGAHNSPSAVVNPRDPDNLVVVNRVDEPDFTAVLHRSVDGGRTWSTTELPLPEGTGRPEGSGVELGPEGEVRFVETQRPYAPDAAFTPDGTLYVSYVNLMGQGNVPDNLWLARSDDGGASLSEPTRVAGELTFQARVAVGPDGVVHLTYLQAETVGVWALPESAPVVAVRSEDGGETFTDPVRVSDPGRPRVGAATPVVDAGGDLVVLYQDFKNNVRDFLNLEGPAWGEPSALVVSRSSDGGESFSPGVELDDGLIADKRFVVFLPEFPSLAAGPEPGELYVAWADAREGSRDVFLRRSGDGGRTWGDRVQVNDNPADDGTSQYLPAVAVSDRGRVDVVYLDRRNDPEDVMTEVSLATSGDRGASFDTILLSSQAFDATIGPSLQNTYTEPDVGSRLGLASWDSGALAAWADTRIGEDTPELARQDLVTARASLPDVAVQAARRDWLVTAPLTALAALGVAALMLLARRRARRR